jgi:membrane-associated protein
MDTFVDLFVHLDTHLVAFAEAYGPWIYAILFLVIFIETGLVVWPFLPGDSLLFATGALVAVGALNPLIVLSSLIAAAILGDAVNYAAGRFVGPRVFTAQGDGRWLDRLLNREHLARAHAFFERYGGKAVVLGRFVPIVRTFVPFVAGAGAMTYPTFVFYNVIGAVIWVGVCVGAGYFVGNVPFVKNNFSVVTLAIIFVSVLPALVEYVRQRGRT